MKKTNLEKCYKCKISKDILKSIMYYGKKSFICLDCKEFKNKPNDWGMIESYYLPSDKIN